MIEIIPPFNIRSSEIINLLSENNFSLHFSFKQKLYYSYLRSLIPKLIRKLIQEKTYANVSYEKDFINKKIFELFKLNAGNKFGSTIFPGNYSTAIVLTHDVEERTGFNFIPKVIELEEKYGFKSSWNIVPYKYKIDEGIINLIKKNGHEIGIHGYNHDGKLYFSEKIFNERATYINLAIKKYNAAGFRSPMVHRNLTWLQKLDIKYDASCFDYDPFQPFPGGTGSIWPFIAGKFVELPYTMPQDHTMFYVLKQKDISIWKNKADWIAKNNGVILTLVHPDYLVEKKNFEMYEELLKYLKNINDAWYCIPKDLAEFWKEKTLENKN